MNQININPAPAVSMRITKNTSEIYWFSQADKHSQGKNKKLKKALKKNKEND